LKRAQSCAPHRFSFVARNKRYKRGGNSYREIRQAIQSRSAIKNRLEGRFVSSEASFEPKRPIDRPMSGAGAPNKRSNPSS
jgi:hypothetical protein